MAEFYTEQTKPEFVFVSGVPGSSWSMISHRLKVLLDLDCSDVDDSRQYNLPVREGEANTAKRTGKRIQEGDKSHFGCYFGPYNEFGDKFDDIKNNYTLEEFYEECRRPFVNGEEGKPKCIRSHWFSYNLDWLWDNCKGQDLFLLYKNSQTSRDWWFERGGWNIHHPVYTWYENDERLFEQIKIENTNLLNFAEEKGLEWETYNEEWWQLRFGKKEKEFRFRPPVKEYLNQISVIYTKIT
jgi:hypothetical protein